VNDQFDAVRRACADVISAFAYYVDHREFAKAVDLFAVDAIFERPDLKAHGREQIAAIFAARPNTVVTRHLCGEPFFLELGSDTARAVTQVTLYNVNHEGEGFPSAQGPNALAEFHDIFKRTADGWKIAHRKGVPVLMLQH
jgi:ketosteroid isomerase-like protein